MNNELSINKLSMPIEVNIRISARAIISNLGEDLVRGLF